MKKAVLALTLILALVFILNISYSVYIWQSAETAALYWGSRGNDVIEVQRRLKNWGYYEGVVDGIYGAETYRAVRKFQSKNGLAVDGIVGDATRRALGMPVEETRYQASRGISGGDSTYLLAQAIHGEARGEPYIGQVAVGAVILNRVNHPSFPNSIPGVIFQPGAFTAVSDGQMYMNPGDTALKAARDAISGWDPSGGAIYYYNPAKTTNKWIYSRPVVKVIGKHWFAK